MVLCCGVWKQSDSDLFCSACRCCILYCLFLIIFYLSFRTGLHFALDSLFHSSFPLVDILILLHFVLFIDHTLSSLLELGCTLYKI